ncbi:DUF2254 family protein [Marinobacterium aestuariivivens]|uniref:DUF2254 family protein n=1 Tax=Marinobacterium aestuariivivens TaxID=1698799 RepID=A0ABW1ZVE1_9GAMM
MGQAFVIGGKRTFDDDPRFGLVVLSEIASRALSPAVNDPGTAIDVIGTLVRLFTLWCEEPEEAPTVEFDRVEIPPLQLEDMFDDAFSALARDGAQTVEVCIRLQKGLRSLFMLPDRDMAQAALSHAQLALRHAEQALRLPEEVEAVRTLTAWAEVAGLQRPGNGRP